MTTPEEKSLLEDALISWRTSQTKIRGNVSLNSFADYLGASRSIVSMWMLGERPITEKYKKKIALPLFQLVGPRSYEVLGVAPVDEDLERLSNIWNFIPENIRRSWLKQGESYVRENENDKQRNIRRTKKTA